MAASYECTATCMQNAKEVCAHGGMCSASATRRRVRAAEVHSVLLPRATNTMIAALTLPVSLSCRRL